MEQKAELLKRFFADGKTVILPIDHGTAIPVPGLERPGQLIAGTRSFVDGDAVNLGLARHCERDLEGAGICFRIDCYKPAHGDNPDQGSFPLFTVEDALEAGAHAVMNMCYPGHPNEAAITSDCARLVSDCSASELPVIIESLPFGLGRPDDYTVENIGFAARVAAELGADVVKTAYPTGATVEEFAGVIESCFVPVIVLGGAAMGDDRALLTMVKKAMDAGAAGIAVGRNVWQHPAPATIARALRQIVHEGADVETALAGMAGN